MQRETKAEQAALPTLRRVKKVDATQDSWIRPDGLAVCLDCWKSWMLTDDRDLSASRMHLSGGDDEPVGYESDPYYEQRKADYRIGEAANAMIDSLKPAWRWAIYKKCSITTQWNFPSIDLLTVMPEIENKLVEMLRKNIATSHLF